MDHYRSACPHHLVISLPELAIVVVDAKVDYINLFLYIHKEVLYSLS